MWKLRGMTSFLLELMAPRKCDLFFNILDIPLLVSSSGRYVTGLAVRPAIRPEASGRMASC